MVRTRCWWCGVVVALGVGLGCARRAVPEYPPLASSERQASTGQAPVTVLSLRQEFTFDEQGNWQQRTVQTYRVVNRAGVDSWGSVGAAWSPWYMAKPELLAEVRDPGGAVRKLDPKVIAESSAYPDVPDVYGDRRVLRAPLPGVQVGSVVTESITRKTTRPFFPGGSWFQIPFQTAIPRDQVELVVDLPEALPFQYELRDLMVRRQETRQNGRRRIVFSGARFAAIQPNDGYAPGNVAEWPSVAFSTGASWRDIASAYEKLMEEKLAGAAGVAELARRSVKEGATPLEKANQLLHALHERVRYASVSFGEAAIVPATPAETLTRTYGDCKDQSLVLVSMLRAVGLPATLALLRAGPGEDVHARLPGLNAFDHAIVVVPGETPIWIDPTSDVARAGELPEGDQARLALVIADDTEGLTRTPSMSAAENTYLETREVALSDEGEARITEVSTSTGALEQRVRGSFAPSEQERTEGLQAYVKEMYDSGKLTASRFDALEDPRTPFRLSLQATSESYGASDLYTASVPLNHAVVYGYLPSPLLDRSPGDEPRKGDLWLPLRYRAELRYRIVPAPHYRVKALPQPKPIQAGPLQLSREVRLAKDGAIEAVFKLVIDKQRLTPAEQQAIRAGLDAVDAEPLTRVELEHESVRAFETGKSAEGMRLLLQESREQPDRASPLVRLALKLSELGFGREARERLQAGAARSPRDALILRSLGFVLSRDPYGRWLKKGHERTAAIAAHRKALEVEADSTFSQTELAVLLEYDDDGVRYATPAGVDEAIRIYDSISPESLESYQSGGFRFNALHALINVGRWQELGERLHQLPDDVPAYFAIAHATATGSAAAGLAEADRRNLRGEARADALSTAAGFVYLHRRYADAAALFEEAAKSSSASAGQYDAKARLLRQAKSIEPDKLKQDTPEALVLKSRVQLMASSDLEAVKRLWSTRATPPTKLLRGALLGAKDLGDGRRLSPQVLADVGAAMMKLSSEGSDAVGYRVRVKSFGLDAASGSETTEYIVKEGGRYAIRADGDGSGALGCEALDRAQKHDDKAARQWLAWAALDLGERSGDDPLAKPAFLRAWDGGKGNLELAATVLCAHEPSSKDARKELLRRRGFAGEGSSVIEQALAETASHDQADELKLSAAEQLLRLHPTSKRARRFKIDALRALGRSDAHERELSLAVAADKGHGVAQSELYFELAEAQAARGKLVESRKTLQRLIDDATSFDRSRAYNNAAWAGLFMATRPKDVLEQAQRAVQLSRVDSYSSLHTLACVQLELGNFGETQKLFDKLLELDQEPELSDGTRYVLGGLAEAYGLRDEARRAYESLKPSSSKTSSYALGQRRLKALDAAPRSK